MERDNKGRFTLGHNPYLWTGKKHSKKSRKKISESRKRAKGKNAPNWKGGINKENIYALKKQYRARKRGASGSHTLAEWQTLKAQYNWTCPACKRKEPEIKLTEDHIIPLSKGGSHNIENIQPLCKSCNSKKRVKIIKYQIS